MNWAPSSATKLTLKQLGVDVTDCVASYLAVATDPCDEALKYFAHAQQQTLAFRQVSLAWRPNQDTIQDLLEQGYPLSLLDDLLPCYLCGLREGWRVTNLDRGFVNYVRKRFTLPKSTDGLTTLAIQQHLHNRGYSGAAISLLSHRYLQQAREQPAHVDFVDFVLQFNPTLVNTLVQKN